MSKSIHERTINGKVFKVSQFPAMRGWKVFTKLAKGVFPAIAGLAGSVKDWDNDDIDLDREGLVEAVKYIVTELDENKSEALIRDLLELTWCDGQEVMPQFDNLFKGDYGTLFKVLAFSVEVNYKSFLENGGIDKLKSLIPAKTAE